MISTLREQIATWPNSRVEANSHNVLALQVMLVGGNKKPSAMIDFTKNKMTIYFPSNWFCTDCAYWLFKRGIKTKINQYKPGPNKGWMIEI